eukprot:2961907-Prymnesium_polylepis.1
MAAGATPSHTLSNGNAGPRRPLCMWARSARDDESERPPVAQHRGFGRLKLPWIRWIRCVVSCEMLAGTRQPDRAPDDVRGSKRPLKVYKSD